MKPLFRDWLFDYFVNDIWRMFSKGNRDNPGGKYAIEQEVEEKINALTVLELVDLIDRWAEDIGLLDIPVEPDT